MPDAPDLSLLLPDGLSPQPTGSSASSSDGAPRRATAYYPNLPRGPGAAPKPFSRSAAKRASVMALGSIEHLQHYFTKTGLSAPTNPFKESAGAAPALGHSLHLLPPPERGSLPSFNLPPTPALPAPPARLEPVPRAYEVDPATLRPGVIADLAATARAWSAPAPEEEGASFDVLGALQTTTRAVRHVRNYALALPDAHAAAPTAPREEYRSKVAAAARRVPSSSAPPPREENDTLAQVRKAALAVLAVLRELEERARLPLSDAAYEAHSDHMPSPTGATSSLAAEPLARSTSGSDAGDASFAYTLVKVAGRAEHVPVWEEDAPFNDAPPTPGRDGPGWDARLVLQSGWLYRPDLRLADLEREQSAVETYLAVVDAALFGGTVDGTRGWEREREKLERRERADKQARALRRRASAGIPEAAAAEEKRARRVVSAMLPALSLSDEPEEMGVLAEEDDVGADEPVDDDHLPGWARRDAYTDDPLGRIHAFFAAHTPPFLASSLPSEPAELLRALSAGQLLCEAYNAALRGSRRPWGFVAKAAVHDLRGEDAGDWTFRRVDNLRIWAAALKLRYSIPLGVPPPANANAAGTPAPSPRASSFRPALPFDALRIARRDDGWEAMLDGAVRAWVGAVLGEVRGEAAAL